MERFKRTFSFRKSKKARVPESSKPHQWQEDERKVRDATCSFQVRYLGCIEVFESRGMQVCEEAVKVLKSQCKGRYQRAVLYVSGDALRVVDEISKRKVRKSVFRRKRHAKPVYALLYISGDSLRVVEDTTKQSASALIPVAELQTKGLIVDQTIEKVSFCAPDRNHEKGFAYICRDGTTRRWMCHGFLAVKESGERLSHAVGCAFAVCLEKKQKRDKDSGTTDVSVTFNADKTSFTRQGSFRQTTMTERLTDPQSAKIADPVPVNDIFKEALSPVSVARPHASDNMLLRQGSFRGFSKLSQSSPFKRQLSLRLNDLPSTLQRQQGTAAGTEEQLQHQQGTVSPIAEVSPSHEVAQSPRSSEQSQDSISEMCKQLTSGLTALTSDDPFASVPQQQNISMNVAQHSPQPAFAPPIPNNQPIIQGNPWDTTSNAVNNNSPAVNGDFWLKTNQHADTNRTDPLARARGSAANITFNSQRPAMGHGRSHSFDTGEMFMHHQQKRPTLQEIARQDTHNGAMNSTWQGPTATPPGHPGFDPFDAAWAAKAANRSLTSNENRNPFNNGATGQMKQFEVKL